jgi:hypothetical protein
MLQLIKDSDKKGEKEELRVAVGTVVSFRSRHKMWKSHAGTWAWALTSQLGENIV